ARLGIIPNVSGRVVEAPGSDTPLRGVYAAGWIKCGPQGIIGTNKACASETIDHVLADAVSGSLPPAARRPDELDRLLVERNIDVTTWSDWLAIDRAEVERGRPAGRPREKFTSVGEMLEIARRSRWRRYFPLVPSRIYPPTG